MAISSTAALADVNAAESVRLSASAPRGDVNAVESARLSASAPGGDEIVVEVIRSSSESSSKFSTPSDDEFPKDSKARPWDQDRQPKEAPWKSKQHQARPWDRERQPQSEQHEARADLDAGADNVSESCNDCSHAFLLQRYDSLIRADSYAVEQQRDKALDAEPGAEPADDVDDAEGNSSSALQAQDNVLLPIDMDDL
jgi:hypothetical protein